MATIRYYNTCRGMKDVVEVVEQGNVHRQCLSCGVDTVIVCVDKGANTRKQTPHKASNVHVTRLPGHV